MTGGSRLRLFPVLVKGGADHCLVIRRDTGKMLRTTPSGVDSIRLLRKGLTIDRTRAVIGAKYGCAADDVDIMPLIHTLLDADFVQAVDGRVVSTPVRHGAWPIWRAYLQLIRAGLTAQMIRWAPITVSLRVMLRRRPNPDTGVVARIARNMRSAPALARAGADIQQLAADNAAILREFYFERLLLALFAPAALDRWLRTRARLVGAAHLNHAAAVGQGVILCAAHLRAYSVIPFLLASRGYAPLVLMDATDDSAQEVRARITQVRRAGYRYAIEPVSVHRGLRTVVRALERGAVVLVLVDTTVNAASAAVTVSFLGAPLRVARGVAWLASRTTASVMPIGIRREGVGYYCAEIGPPLAAAEGADEPTMLGALARRIERDVLAEPASWLKWKDFHVMIGPGHDEHRSAPW
jgi:lauroyl/myristoyl acyltransferase